MASNIKQMLSSKMTTASIKGISVVLLLLSKFQMHYATGPTMNHIIIISSDLFMTKGFAQFRNKLVGKYFSNNIKIKSTNLK